MAAISSWQFMAWPVSARTLAAASRALSLLALAVTFFDFGADLPRAAAADFLALAARGVEWVGLVALMVVSCVADLRERLPSSGDGNPPPRRPAGRFGFFPNDGQALSGRCVKPAGAGRRGAGQQVGPAHAVAL